MTGATRLTLPRAAFGAALGLMLAAPAFAQSSQGQQAQGGTPQSNSGQQRSQAQVMGQDKLRQQLTQAGFREVQILDAAYLVQAKTQDGNTVLMMIDPPHGSLQSSGAQGSSTSGAGTSSSPSASGGSGSRSGSGSGR